MHQRRSVASKGGFSLIELVVTIAILGLLATVAVPFAQLVQQRQKEAELREGLRQIRVAIDTYKQAVMEGRIDKATLRPQGYPPDLDVLWKGIADKTKPDDSQIYFLRRLPRDPFFFRTPQPSLPKPGVSAVTRARRTTPRKARMSTMYIPCLKKRG